MEFARERLPPKLLLYIPCLFLGTVSRDLFKYANKSWVCAISKSFGNPCSTRLHHVKSFALFGYSIVTCRNDRVRQSTSDLYEELAI